MRYLLPTLLLSLLTLAVSTSMADEENETSVAILIEAGTYRCDLAGDDGSTPLGSGCFVFGDTLDAHGRAVALLEVQAPGVLFVSEWKCSHGALESEEIVQCSGEGLDGYVLTAMASGSVKQNPGAGEPDLVLLTAGIAGYTQLGTVGVARCYVEPACQP